VRLGRDLFGLLGRVVTKILSFSYAGSEFVFGEIGKQHSSIGVVFAFQIMPAIIFVSALFAIMYYLGIMQTVVKAFAVAMNKIMGRAGRRASTCRVDLYGPDRGPPHDPAFPATHDPLRADDGHDRRDGSRLRIDHGGVTSRSGSKRAICSRP